MEFRFLFLAFLVLCAVTFFEVLFTIKKNSLLKSCFLLIIASLFVMNYFSFSPITSRLEFVIVKCMRLIYACSTMLAIVRLVSPKIPRWIIGVTAISAIVIIGLRIYYFDHIIVPDHTEMSNHIFNVGPEFKTPIPSARYTVFSLVILATSLTYYYYRKFFMSMNREDFRYGYFSRWILSMVIPFFLLVIFGLFGTIYHYEAFNSILLFSVFSSMIIFSILFRPRHLNNSTLFESRSNLSPS